MTQRRFLARLASAAGLTVLPFLGGAGGPATHCVADAAVDGVCPGAAEALVNYQETWAVEDGCTVISVTGDGRLVDEDTCCYTVELDCADTGYQRYREPAGCMGRPYMEGGHPVVAEIRTRPGKVARVEGLDPARRATLARFWTGVALAEHASIAEFHRISLELLRFGAPAALLRKAQVAAVDEARHAHRCLALASAYAGRLVEPGALPIAATVTLAADLAELAAVTVRDGCVAETCSAWLYDRLRERAEDPAVRDVLAGIVRDETRHAELAWATLRWALDAGGAPVRAAARAALATPPPAPGSPRTADDPRLAAHGWAPSQVQDAIAKEGWRRLVLPLGEALLAA